MGQYHDILSLGAHEYLCPHSLGHGLKMVEQSLSYGGVRAALAALLSRRPGNMPADLGHAPKLVGRWAGQRIMAIGDYAKDGDLPGYQGTIPESQLYHACDEKPVRPAKGYDWLVNGESETQAILRCKREHTARLAEWREFCRTTRPLRNLAPKALGLIESACNVRYHLGKEGWRTYATVKALAERGPDGLPRYGLLNDSQDDREYYQRMTRDAGEWWNRPPLDQQHHGVMDGEVDLGQRRVIANLDKREFIDPRAFGEAPTTAALMRGEDGCAMACLMLMLFHPQRRGGGDIDVASFPLAGAWRGDRLLLTAEHEAPRSRFPDTARTEREFRNISERAVKATASMWQREAA